MFSREKVVKSTFFFMLIGMTYFKKKIPFQTDHLKQSNGGTPSAIPSSMILIYSHNGEARLLQHKLCMTVYSLDFMSNVSVWERKKKKKKLVDVCYFFFHNYYCLVLLKEIEF